MRAKVVWTASALAVALWVGSLGASPTEDAETQPVDLDVPVGLRSEVE